MVAFLEEDGSGYDAQQIRQVSEGIAISPEPRNTYLSEIEEFGNAVIEDREPVNSAQLGLQSQKVLAACYESAKLGSIVEIN